MNNKEQTLSYLKYLNHLKTHNELKTICPNFYEWILKTNPEILTQVFGE